MDEVIPAEGLGLTVTAPSEPGFIRCIVNATHLLDVACWATDVTFPTKVSSFGGRWHDVGLDDWEAPDTQEIQLEFGPERGISWFGTLVQLLWCAGLQGQRHRVLRQQGND